MRNLAEFIVGADSTAVKVTLMHWNEKYVVRVERGPMEQVYKMDATDFSGPDEIRARLNDAFGASCDRAFGSMADALRGLWTP